MDITGSYCFTKLVLTPQKPPSWRLRRGHGAIGQDPGHLSVAAGLVETFAQVLDVEKRWEIGDLLPSGKHKKLWKITCFNGKTHYKWPYPTW